MNKNKTIALLLVMALLILDPAFSLTAAPDTGQDRASQTSAEAETQELIVPGPKDVKESVGIVVFLFWIWLSILVLVYFLRSKIREVDRLHRLRYFQGSDPPSPGD